MGAESAAEEQFGPYLVYERLGVGGMATVHRALERGIEGFERIVALKRLLPHLAEDASFIKSFVREAKLASILNHVNIVQIFELGRVGTEYFISMEYIDGRDIRRILRHARKVTGPPPIHVTVGLLLQLCDALDYAHSKVDDEGRPLGLVHRDVSPSNLLITQGGHLKVIDFGIAKAQSSQLRTQTGRVKGKLAYMAPEAIGGKDLDSRSDLFAVGVIAHELLTARPLFASKNEYQTLIKVQRGDIMPPSTFNQACPSELDAIVLEALARDPDRRYATAAALREDLLELRRRYNLQTGHRDVAQWLDWAFSLEPPSGGFAVTNTMEQTGTGGNSSSALDVKVAAAKLRAPTPIPRPSVRALKEDEEAVEIAWGGGDHEESGAPIVLEDVPDVSDKHRGASSSVEVETRIELDDLDDEIATPSEPPAEAARPARASNVTVGSAMVARQSGRRTWVLIAGLLVAGAAATGVTLYATRGNDTVPDVDEPSPRPPGRTMGTVKFVTEPADADISIEGKPVKKGSPWSTELPAGIHQIQIHRDGYKAWLTSLELSAAETQTLRVVLEPLGGTAVAEATLILSSTPTGLDVVLDGKLLDERTPIKMPIRPGPHVVVLRQDGVEVWRNELHAKANAEYEFSPSMSADKQRERAQRTASRSRQIAVAPAERGPDAAERGPDAAATTTAPAATAPTPPVERTVEKVATPPGGSAAPRTTTPATTTQGATPPQAGSGSAGRPAEITTPANPGAQVARPIAPATSAGPVVVAPTAVTRISGETPTVGKSKRGEVPPVVAAKVCIDTRGSVTKVDVLTKVERMTVTDLTDALESWKYKPYLRNGVPTPACFVVNFRVK